MAFLMKPPEAASKGLIIFTHKERALLSTNTTEFRRLYTQLREQYVTACHWGHFAENVPFDPKFDFHLAAPGTVKFVEPVKRVSLSSRDFIPAVFGTLELPKTWDILTIARPLRLKRLDHLLDIVRETYDRGHRVRVLSVCPRPPDMREAGWHTTLWDDYVDRFDEDERGDFVLAFLGPDGYPFPLAEGAVARLYASARAFAFLSEQEGESRVVAEALLSGLHVIARADVRGGAGDYLDRTNSLRYSTVSEAADAFETVALGNLMPFDRDRFRNLAGEEASVRRLRDALEEVYADLGMPLQGPVDLVGLSRKLPSHERLLPPNLVREVTDDLADAGCALVWFASLLDVEVPPRAVLRARLAERRSRVIELNTARLRGVRRRLHA